MQSSITNLLLYILLSILIFITNIITVYFFQSNLNTVTIYFNAVFLFLGIVVIQMSISNKATSANILTANTLAVVILKLVLTVVAFIVYILVWYNKNKLEIILAFLLYFIYSALIYFIVLKLINKN